MGKRKIILGSVEHGTLKSEDLIDKFRSELHYYHARCPKMPTKREFNEMYGPSEYIDELVDALNRIAPSYCYFGATEGDGSDFGFWVDWDSIETAIYENEIIELPAGNEIPKDWIGFVLFTTDHGNHYLEYRAPNGHVKEIWGIV